MAIKQYNNDLFKLCLITDFKLYQTNPKAYLNFIAQVAQNGVSLVQLRAKVPSDLQELIEFAINLKQILKPLFVPLIINDHVHLAKELDLDGVHVGFSDMGYDKVRKIIGDDKIIGLSIEDFGQIENANLSDITYVTASAVFESKNKKCNKIWGLDGLQLIVQNSIHPVTAIGGITENNLSSIIKSGAQGVAVISAIHEANDPVFTTKKFINIINEELLKCY